jgi:hypothetical protein
MLFRDTLFSEPGDRIQQNKYVYVAIEQGC